MISLVEICSINVSLSILKLIDISIEIDEESSIIGVGVGHRSLEGGVPAVLVIIAVWTCVLLSAPWVSELK